MAHQFPLNPPSVPRSAYANDNPLAPVAVQPEIQTDGFSGIRTFGDMGTDPYGRRFFDEGEHDSETMGARLSIDFPRPQHQDVISGIAPTAHPGDPQSNQPGGYVVTPSVRYTDGPVERTLSNPLGPEPPYMYGESR